MSITACKLILLGSSCFWIIFLCLCICDDSHFSYSWIVCALFDASVSFGERLYCTDFKRLAVISLERLLFITDIYNNFNGKPRTFPRTTYLYFRRTFISKYHDEANGINEQFYDSNIRTLFIMSHCGCVSGKYYCLSILYDSVYLSIHHAALSELGRIYNGIQITPTGPIENSSSYRKFEL